MSKLQVAYSLLLLPTKNYHQSHRCLKDCLCEGCLEHTFGSVLKMDSTKTVKLHENFFIFQL